MRLQSVSSPGGDGVSVLLVNTVHSGHRDLLDVFLLYSHVGALDGHRDPTVKWPEARDDLQKERKHGRVNMSKVSFPSKANASVRVVRRARRLQVYITVTSLMGVVTGALQITPTTSLQQSRFHPNLSQNSHINLNKCLIQCATTRWRHFSSWKTIIAEEEGTTRWCNTAFLHGGNFLCFTAVFLVAGCLKRRKSDESLSFHNFPIDQQVNRQCRPSWWTSYLKLKQHIQQPIIYSDNS